MAENDTLHLRGEGSYANSTLVPGNAEIHQYIRRLLLVPSLLRVGMESSCL